MKKLLLALLYFSSTQLLLAQGVLTTLGPLSDRVAPGEPVNISLLVLNPTTDSILFHAPRLLRGKLIVRERSLAVELHADKTQSQSIEAGAFARHGYAFMMPADVSGLVYLEVIGPDSVPMRTVLLTKAPFLLENSSGLATVGAPVAPAAASIDRTFWNRFGAHEAIYFVYGGDDPAAKFQLSFKYRLHGLGVEENDQAFRALQFGYTQRSLWDINGNSSPFYDTSYMPSLFFESFAPPPAKADAQLTWLGYQTGFQHESNGGAGADSRSLNTLFFRRAVMIGSFKSWHLLVSPKFSVYVGGLSDNPNLTNYRGYADWMVALAKSNGTTLTYTGRAGKSFGHFSTQLDLTIPVRSKLLDFATYLTLQYFNGYGESLRSFDQQTETLRVGFSLVRLR